MFGIGSSSLLTISILLFSIQKCSTMQNNIVHEERIMGRHHNYGNGAASSVHEKCGSVDRKEMEEFVYIPDEEFNEISKRPKQKEMRILKQKSESGKGFVAQVFIGYFGTMEESFDQKKCAAVRITPKSKDTEGENTLKVIRKIYKELPESGRKHIITFFDIGKVSGTQDYVAVMELAKGNLKDVYKGENLDTKEAIKRLEKQIGKIVVPALEMHEIFAHLDLKFANYVVVSNDINGSRINKEGGKEEEDEVVKAIDFGASTLLDDGGIMPAGNNAAKANCLVKPLWEFRTEEIAGPEYGDDDIQVSGHHTTFYRI